MNCNRKSFIMPELNKPVKLETLSMRVVAKYIQESCTYLESQKSENNHVITSSEEILRDKIERQVENTPGPILEILLVEVIHKQITEIVSRRTSKGLIEALHVLLRPCLKSVDLGRMFSRLPRNITAPCEVLLPMKLMHMSYLSELDLLSRCTDEILSTLSRCCPFLKKLNISYSDLVTDAGLRYLCGLSDEQEKETDGTCCGCKKINSLGLEKLWETTVEGVRAIVEGLPELQFMRYDQIGEIFFRKLNETYPSHSVTKIPKKCEEYRLAYFDQTYNVFTPSDDLIDYITECCPHVCMLKLYAPDSFLPSFKSWKKVENFALEIDGACGPGLINYFESVGSNLVVINISFDSLESKHLKALGKYCPKVKELTLMGTEMNENEALKNENYFTELEVFNMSIWDDEGITGALLLFFLSSSKGLKKLNLSASVIFLNDNYFNFQILGKYPLSKLEELCIQGNPRVPLTMKTARLILRVCPSMRKLSLSRWRVTEKSIRLLQKEMKLSNYDITII
ncbi:hypothetical protein J437_LFUL011318 [Ladona fulva]|uniref:Uncharacterized protein n=1 Tax=Ladona fulva TaxID=123851 RepID=A0A8K0P7B2_LADFU|nr:hypothetical protein J437_LFUL011318 [Ladona fulva]